MYADIFINSATLEVMMAFQDGRIYEDEPLTDTITYLLFVMEYFEDVNIGHVKNDKEEMQRYIKHFDEGVGYFFQIDEMLMKEGAYPTKKLMETMFISGTDLMTEGLLLGRRHEMGKIAQILNKNFEHATEEDREQWQSKYFDFCDKIMKKVDELDNKSSEEELKAKMIKYVKWVIIVIVIWYIFF